MEEERLHDVREMIKAKRFNEARAILETMPDNATAQKWLQQINNQTAKSKTISRGVGNRLFFGGLLIGLVLGYAVGNTGSSATPPVRVVTATPLPVPTEAGPTRTPTATATITETPVPTMTSTPSETPTLTPTAAPIAYSGQGAQVIGPVTFSDGTYKVVLISANGWAHMGFEELEGDCDLVPNVGTDIQGGRDEGAFTFEGCRTLIEISGNGTWTLTFELVE